MIDQTAGCANLIHTIDYNFLAANSVGVRIGTIVTAVKGD